MSVIFFPTILVSFRCAPSSRQTTVSRPIASVPSPRSHSAPPPWRPPKPTVHLRIYSSVRFRLRFNRSQRAARRVNYNQFRQSRFVSTWRVVIPRRRSPSPRRDTPLPVRSERTSQSQNHIVRPPHVPSRARDARKRAHHGDASTQGNRNAIVRLTTTSRSRSRAS